MNTSLLYQELQSAIQEKEYEKINFFINMAETDTEKKALKNLALIEASCQGYLQIVREIILNNSDMDVSLAIYGASINDSISIIRFIINHYFNKPELYKKYYPSMIQGVCESGTLTTMKYIHRLVKLDRNNVKIDYNEALVICVEYNNQNIFKWIIENNLCDLPFYGMEYILSFDNVSLFEWLIENDDNGFLKGKSIEYLVKELGSEQVIKLYEELRKLKK